MIIARCRSGRITVVVGAPPAWFGQGKLFVAGLLLPAALGAQTVSVTPTSVALGEQTTVTWSGFSGNVNLELWQGGAFTGINPNTDVAGSGSQVLDTGAHPIWGVHSDYRVRVALRVPPDGMVAFSNYFAVTAPVAPPPPSPTYPPNGTVWTADNTPDLAWSFTGNVNYFWVQVDNNGDFSSPEVDNPNIPTLNISPAVADGTYWWRVRSHGSNGTWSEWSTVWTFTVNTTPTACYQFTRSAICRDVQPADPYDPIAEIDCFSASYSRVYAWVRLDNIYCGLTVRFIWIDPSGQQFGAPSDATSPHPNTQGYPYWTWWKYWSWWPLSGASMADLEGPWTVQILVDDGGGFRTVATKNFTIRYRLAEHVISRNFNATDPSNLGEPTSSFNPAESRAYSWVHLNNVSDPLQIRWEWYAPSGNLYLPGEYTSASPGENGCWGSLWTWMSMDIAGTPAAQQPGQWEVRGFIRNAFGTLELVYNDHFNIEGIPSPPPPALLAPAHLAIFNRNDEPFVILEWSRPSGALEFELNVFPSGNSANPTFKGSVLDAASFLAGIGDWANGEYVWEVRVRTTGGWSGWSGPDARHFIADTPPSPPTLVDPLNGKPFDLDSSTTFQWNPPVGTIAEYCFAIRASWTGEPACNLNPTTPTQPVTFDSGTYQAGPYTWGARALKVTPPGYDDGVYRTKIGFSQYAKDTFTLRESKPTINNQPPECRISVTGANPGDQPGVYKTSVGHTITFSAAASTDPNAAAGDFIAHYEWSSGCGAFFTDAECPGPYSDACNVSETWNTAGSYCMQLRVTDQGNPAWSPPGPLSSQCTITVEVSQIADGPGLHIFDGTQWKHVDQAPPGLFDRTKMTAVIVHGWNPTCGVTQLNDPGIQWMADMAMALRSRLGAANINVLAWDWLEDAVNKPYRFLGELRWTCCVSNDFLCIPSSIRLVPGDKVRSQGETIAAALEEFLSGNSYTGMPIQLFGHSLGAHAIAWAAKEMIEDNVAGRSPYYPSQITCFDPPSFFTGAPDICEPITYIRMLKPDVYTELYDGVTNAFARRFELFVDVPYRPVGPEADIIGHFTYIWYTWSIAEAHQQKITLLEQETVNLNETTPPFIDDVGSMLPVLPGKVGFGASVLLQNIMRPPVRCTSEHESSTFTYVSGSEWAKFTMLPACDEYLSCWCPLPECRQPPPPAPPETFVNETTPPFIDGDDAGSTISDGQIQLRTTDNGTVRGLFEINPVPSEWGWLDLNYSFQSSGQGGGAGLEPGAGTLLVQLTYDDVAVTLLEAESELAGTGELVTSEPIDIRDFQDLKCMLVCSFTTASAAVSVSIPSIGVRLDPAYNNQPPVAMAGDDIQVVADSDGFALITITGEKSSDPEDSELQYNWVEVIDEVTEVTLSNEAVVTIALPVGTHILRLCIYDDRLAFSCDEVTVTIVARPTGAWVMSGLLNSCAGPKDTSGALWYETRFDDLNWTPVTLPHQVTSSQAADRFYRQHLYFETVPEQALASFVSDDGLWLYVNGSRVGAWGPGCHQPGCVNGTGCGINAQVGPQDIARFLQAGSNVIAVHVSNAAVPNRMYFDFQMRSIVGKPGDANQDNKVDLSDAVYILGCLFLGTPCPMPLSRADVNCSGKVDITDPIYLLGCLFLGSACPVSCSQQE